MSAAAEETVTIPPSEKVAINSMADKFKGIMANLPQEPAAIAKPPDKPAEAKPAEKPAEQPKPAEKPAEASTAPPEIKGKAREQFETLEKEMKKWRGEHDKLKAEYDKLKPESESAKTKLAEMQAHLDEAAKIRAEHEETKKKFDEQDKIIKQFYIEHSPEFKAHFGQKISSAILEAKEAVGPELSARVEQALQVPPSPFRDKQIAELAEGLDDFAKAALVTAYTELKRTERERQSELAKAPENYRKLQELQSKRAQEEAEKAIASRSALLQHVTAQIDPELGDAAPELAVEIKNRTKAIVEGSASTETYIGLLVDAARGKKYSATVKDQAEKIAKLEAQIAELSTAQPSLSGQPSASAKAGEPEDMGVKYRRALQAK